MLEFPADLLERSQQVILRFLTRQCRATVETDAFFDFVGRQQPCKIYVGILVGIDIEIPDTDIILSSKYPRLQKIAERQLLVVLQDVNILEVELHQQEKVVEIELYIADFALFLTLEEMTHDEYDTVPQFVFIH